MKIPANSILNFILILIILAAQNGHAQNKTISGMKSSELQYSDGNGNVWKIDSASIHYIPVKPNMSSSGIYSGGEEKTSKIEEREFLLILQEFEGIFNNKSIHIRQRIMTSGYLSILERGKKEREVIFKSGKEKDKLEKLLKKFIGN